MKAKLGVLECVVETFPRRCPYCDQVLSYDQSGLKKGENRVECPSCKGIFIKVIPSPSEREAT